MNGLNMVSDIKLLHNQHAKSPMFSYILDNQIYSAVYGKDHVPDDNTYDKLVDDLDHDDVDLIRLEDKC